MEINKEEYNFALKQVEQYDLSDLRFKHFSNIIVKYELNDYHNFLARSEPSDTLNLN